MGRPAAQQQLNNIWTFIYSWTQASGPIQSHVLLSSQTADGTAALAFLSCCCPVDVHGGVCVCVPEPHLKTGNSETAGVVRGGRHRDDEGTVWDVLVVEADGHLVVACKQSRRSKVNTTSGKEPPGRSY